jgi:hypothetical protein
MICANSSASNAIGAHRGAPSFDGRGQPSAPSATHSASARITNAMPRWIASRTGDTLSRSNRPLVTIHQPIAPCAAPSANSSSVTRKRPRSRPVKKKNSAGTANATPTTLPRKRCAHSHQ